MDNYATIDHTRHESVGLAHQCRSIHEEGRTLIYLWFAVAVVALTASLTRSVVGTAGAAIGILLLLPSAAAIPAIKPWLPSTLAEAQVAMVRTDNATNYVRAATMSIVATSTILVIALRRFRHREV